MTVEKSLFTDISDRLFDKFVEYHGENPHIYDLFKQFSFEIGATKKRYGAKAIMERIRWHVDTTSAGSAFKLNNNFTSFYARLLSNEVPAFNDFFKKRKREKESRLNG